MLTDVNRFARCGEEGVLALLSDSTNVEKEGYTISDRRRSARTWPGSWTPPPAALSWPCSPPMYRPHPAGRRHRPTRGRKVVFNGRSIEVSVAIARKLGYLTCPDHGDRHRRDRRPTPTTRSSWSPPAARGSPCPPWRAWPPAPTSRSRSTNEDTVILSSKFIPGNEKAIANIINNLYRRGADVVYEKISQHPRLRPRLPGRAQADDQPDPPKYFIPVHGEYRHLVLHSRLAREVGIPTSNVILAQNGQIVELRAEGGFPDP
jgi:ribonuclease J